jgi:hypothetical protein
MSRAEVHLWLWTITDEVTGKRRQTRHRMTEEDARARHRHDAQKAAGSLEVRRGGGLDQRLPAEELRFGHKDIMVPSIGKAPFDRAGWILIALRGQDLRRAM